MTHDCRWATLLLCDGAGDFAHQRFRALESWNRRPSDAAIPPLAQQGLAGCLLFCAPRRAGQGKLG
jgi:hypothetical protein